MSYRGIAARLPVGAQGFTGTQNPSQAGPGHLLYVDGAELDAGIIRKDGGALLFNMANPAHGGLLDSFTKVLIHGDARGSGDAQISLPDSANTSRVWTAAGNAQIDTADSKFGAASILFDGSGDVYTAPDEATWAWGAASVDLTFECWFKCTAATGTIRRIMGQNTNGFASAAVRNFNIQRTNTDVIQFTMSNGTQLPNVTGTTVFNSTTNTGWHHLACTRVAGVMHMFIDGVEEGTASLTFTGSTPDIAEPLCIGAATPDANSPWQGWIDEVRISVGVARWTANFTPPTAPYADYTVEPDRKVGLDILTKSLLHFEGADASTTAIESSTVSRTWTAAGNAQLDNAQFKFGATSGLFDGTGDLFSTPDTADLALLGSDFTIDFWFRCNAAGGTVLNLCGQSDAVPAAVNSSFFIQRTAGNFISAQLSTGAAFTTITGTTQFTNAVNTGWHHVAFTRFGNNIFLWIDGVLEATAAFTGAVADSVQVLTVGARDSGAATPWNGWIDEFRYSVGVARWTAAFQPPSVAHVIGATSSYLASQGFANHDQFQDQTIVAGIHWPGGNGTGQNLNVIAVSSGAVLSSVTGGFNNLLGSFSGGLGNEPPPHFVFGGGEAVGSIRRLFLFSKENLPQVTTQAGTISPTMAAVTPPGGGDWSGSGNFPTFGCLHVFRMFAGGNASDPHRLYYTSSTDHTSFAGAGSGTLAIYPGEGEKIVGAISFRGALIVWKYPQGIYVVDTTDPTPGNWKVDRLTKAIGCLNQQSIVQIENDVSFVDRSGNIHLLSAVNEFGDLNTSNLSEVADLSPFIRANTNLNLSQKNVGQWYAAKRQLWYGMIQKASSQNDLRIQCTFEGLQQKDQQQGGFPPRFFMSRRDVLTALWSYPDPAIGILKPMIGDNDGFVWYMDQDTRNKNGVGYVIQFATASTDLAFVDPALATKQKNGEFLELAYEPRGDWDLTVDIFWDDIYQQTILFNMGGSGGTLGSFVLDTDQLGSEGARSQRQRLEGSGRRFKLAAINQGVNEDVSLSEFHISFSVGDERTLEI